MFATIAWADQTLTWNPIMRPSNWVSHFSSLRASFVFQSSKQILHLMMLVYSRRLCNLSTSTVEYLLHGEKLDQHVAEHFPVSLNLRVLNDDESGLRSKITLVLNYLAYYHLCACVCFNINLSVLAAINPPWKYNTNPI